MCFIASSLWSHVHLLFDGFSSKCWKHLGIIILESCQKLLIDIYETAEERKKKSISFSATRQNWQDLPFTDGQLLLKVHELMSWNRMHQYLFCILENAAMKVCTGLPEV